jgi:hypothetical protein
MKYLQMVLLFVVTTVLLEARTVYFDGENGSTDVWLARDDNAIIRNIYDEDLGSRVVSLSPGTYDIGLGDRSWNNTTERVLSWDMKITDAYTIYVSVDTTEGHRWLFYNRLNVDVGFHGAGILNGIGHRTNNGTWQRVVVDLDRDLRDTEPNNRIIRVNGMRFGGTLGSIDNITLDNPTRRVYENGNNGTANWRISDNDPEGATITLVAEDSDSDETRENVIRLSGNEENNSYTIGDTNSQTGWNNRNQEILQLKMRNNELFTLIVHVQTQEGDKELVYTPVTTDSGISNDGLQIHHGLAKSRDGEGADYGPGTDNRWQTYTIDLKDDLHDYDPDNTLIAVNGITIKGSTLVDDVELFHISEPNGPIEAPPTVYEDAEDGTIDGWRVRQGSNGDIINVFDTTSNSRVIQLTGGGSYILGALNGDNAWHNTTQKMISWKMRSNVAYAIYVVVNTTHGLRYLFYTTSPNRGLRHGFEGGIHHGLGTTTIDGRWRTITRDLQRDLKDAEPENDLIEVNGIIYNGGNNGMLDDIVLYNANERVYEDGEHGIDNWVVSDNTPSGATITNIEDTDRQGRHLQGNIISLNGSGFDNAYMIGGVDSQNGWNNQNVNILQWRFRNFGPEVEVLENRGVIRDPNAFEFRVFVETQNGHRELIYTLGAENLGLIENGTTIHHGLGDDRVRGSVWSGDDPMNELGLWQTLTRDLQEDIWDFEPNNNLISVNGFQVRNSGLVDDIKMLSNAVVSQNNSGDNDDNGDDDNNNNANSIVYEDAQDGNTDGWSVFINTSGTATISNIMDNNRNSRVIQLQGDGLADAYRLRDAQNHRWNDTNHNMIEWSMNYTEAFTIYIEVQTTNGHRYLVYTPRDDNRGIRGEYIRLGVGANMSDGSWHTITRDIQADIHTAEPDNNLVAIESFIIRGSGLLDDIRTLSNSNDNGDNGDDNGDDNNNDDNNNNDDDNNGDNNDNNIAILEDAENGNTNGWTIFANTSGTATISNIMDNDRGSRVISLQGDRKADAYRFRSEDNHNWNDTTHHNIRWSMNYNEDYTIYISVRTTEGRRYLTYTPRDDNRGVRGDYILIGLGANSNNGSWQTFSRDLQADISSFENGNNLIAIDSIIIRGSGRIDDIGVF